MEDNNTIIKNNGINTNLTEDKQKQLSFKIDMTLSIDDVRKQALLLYGSVSGFSRKLGITHGLGSRLLSGSYVPLRASGIQKISDALHIDPIILTRIYDDITYKKKNKKEADKNGIIK